MADDRLAKALKFSNYRVTLFQQLEALKLKTANSLMYSCNGGTFKIDRELIAFVDILHREKLPGAFLTDINELPIFIDDVPAFFNDIYTLYFEVMNDYGAEYARIRKARKVAAVTEFGEQPSSVGNEISTKT